MLKVGQYYISIKGRLVKILNEFNFQDGYKYNAAYFHPGAGWIPLRYKSDGACSTDTAYNNLTENETFETFLTFMTNKIWFDRVAKTWSGTASGPLGDMIITLTGIESGERCLKLLQLGAQEKVLTWMKESGYVEETEKTS